MKVRIIFLLAMLINLVAIGCPVCERNKSKAENWLSVHGSSPESNWDYVIVVIVIIVAVASLYYTVKWLINPKENNKEHIKYLFINPEQDA